MCCEDCSKRAIKYYEYAGFKLCGNCILPYTEKERLIRMDEKKQNIGEGKPEQVIMEGPATILFETKDKRTRAKFSTGALRSSHVGRGRFDLVSPIGLRRLAIRYEAGAVQKGERNWELGFPVSRACCSAMGHLVEYLEGDREEDHPAAIAWQMFAAMHFEILVARSELPSTLLDIPIKT